MRDSTGALERGGRPHCWEETGVSVRGCKQECSCDGGVVRLNGPLLLRNFGLAVKRESQAEP